MIVEVEDLGKDVFWWPWVIACQPVSRSNLDYWRLLLGADVNLSNQTVSQGNYTFSGGFGNRIHTFTFSADQGVRDSGPYNLNLLLSGSAKALGSSPATVANDQRYSWNVP
jgi:hypothetical protein